MQVAGILRRSRRALRAPLSLHSTAFLSPLSFSGDGFTSSASQCRNLSIFPVRNLALSGSGGGNLLQCQWQNSKGSMAYSASFSSGTDVSTGSPTAAVKELYDKMLESIKVMRSAPPNAWLWSMIKECGNRDDVKLLFDVLQHLRTFRLSNLRIHDNFNCNLCQEVTKACIRVGAIDFGKKALWKHNVYGLSPTVASANHLLSHAKKIKDSNLMVDVMRTLKRNGIPLQPATADIVFSICYDADNWELMSKYSKRFLKDGVKLRKTTFDTWMEFTAKRGDTESLWKIEKLRSDTYKEHTIKSGFSCAKGLVLERKPQDAAAVIQILNLSYPDTKRQDIMVELQKLIGEWPSEVIKHQKDENWKVVAGSLKADIPAVIKYLSDMGVEATVNMEDLKNAEALMY